MSDLVSIKFIDERIVRVYSPVGVLDMTNEQAITIAKAILVKLAPSELTEIEKRK